MDNLLFYIKSIEKVKIIIIFFFETPTQEYNILSPNYFKRQSGNGLDPIGTKSM
jgi:hypothetical protein